MSSHAQAPGTYDSEGEMTLHIRLHPEVGSRNRFAHQVCMLDASCEDVDMLSPRGNVVVLLPQCTHLTLPASMFAALE